jgi:FixJ family two-component response regulator
MDAALLDINLNGERVFKLADAIAERGIPIVFLTGHSLDVAPPQHRQRRLVQKSYNAQSVVAALKDAISENRAVAEKESAL